MTLTVFMPMLSFGCVCVVPMCGVFMPMLLVFVVVLVVHGCVGVAGMCFDGDGVGIVGVVADGVYGVNGGVVVGVGVVGVDHVITGTGIGVASYVCISVGVGVYVGVVGVCVRM